jgi:hypothetical protein
LSNICLQLSNSSKWIGNQQIANAQVNESNVRVTRRRFNKRPGPFNKLFYLKEKDRCFKLIKETYSIFSNTFWDMTHVKT